MPEQNTGVRATIDVVWTEVVRSANIVNHKGRPRTKRLKSLMEQTVAKPKKKRNTTKNVAQSRPRAEVHN